MTEEPSLVREGIIYKRVSGWNCACGSKYLKRFWQLFDNGIIDYYKISGKSRYLRGSARLTATSYCYHSHFMRDIFEDCPTKVDNSRCFSLISSSRNFHLYTETEEDRIGWMNDIIGVIEKIKLGSTGH